MQIVVDNLLTNYKKNGTGPVLVLLHGWGDDHRTFAALQASLSQKYEVISLDLPGFGQSQAPLGSWDLDNFTDFVGKFLHKLKINNVFALVGHSNGGAIAVRGLSNGNLQSEKLVLIAAAGVRSGQSLKKALLKAAAKGGKAATFWLPKASRLKLRSRLYGAAKSDMLVAPHLEETFKKIVQQDIQADAKKVNLPALLIYGLSDTAVPVKNGRLLAKLLAGSQLVEMPAAGHFLHQEAPSEVFERIDKFLAQ